MFKKPKRHNERVQYYLYSSPTNKHLPDCVIRALRIVLKDSYKHIEEKLENTPWVDLLLQNGFNRVAVPAVYGENRKTVLDIVKSAHPEDLIVCQGANHLVPIYKQKYIDDRNCWDMPVYAYYIKKDI